LKWLVPSWRWLTRLVTGGSIGQKSAPYRTVTVHDALPSNLEENILYVVDDDGHLEQAAMLCPCGCGLNLLRDEGPCWRLTQHTDGTATLYPSVWRKKDCGSHFWFREGQVFWCNDRMS
jgi:hypothetical protein